MTTIIDGVALDDGVDEPELVYPDDDEPLDDPDEIYAPPTPKQA